MQLQVCFTLIDLFSVIIYFFDLDAQQFMKKIEVVESFDGDTTFISEWKINVSNFADDVISESYMQRVSQRANALVDWVAKKRRSMNVTPRHTQQWITRILEGDVAKVLDEIETALHYILPTGDESSQNQVERILIMLQGSSDAVVSSRVLRMLSSLYAGHLLPFSTHPPRGLNILANTPLPIRVQFASDPIAPELKLVFDICVPSGCSREETAPYIKNLLRIILPRIAYIRLLVNHPPQQSASNRQSSGDSTTAANRKPQLICKSPLVSLISTNPSEDEQSNENHIPFSGQHLSMENSNNQYKQNIVLIFSIF